MKHFRWRVFPQAKAPRFDMGLFLLRSLLFQYDFMNNEIEMLLQIGF